MYPKFFLMLTTFVFLALSQTVAPGNALFGTPVTFWSNIYSIDMSVLPNQGGTLCYRGACSYGNNLMSAINKSYPAVSVINSSHQDAAVTAALLEDYAHSANADAMFYSGHGDWQQFMICLPNTTPATRGMDHVDFGDRYIGYDWNIRFGGYSQFGLYNSWTKWLFSEGCLTLYLDGQHPNQILLNAFDGIHAIIGSASSYPGKQHQVCTKKFMWWCTKQEWRFTTDTWVEFADLWINKKMPLWDSWYISVRDKIANEFAYGIEPAIVAPTGIVFNSASGQWVGWNGYNERFNAVYSDPTPVSGTINFQFSSLASISTVFGTPSY